MKKRVAAAVLTALVACLAFALCGCTEPYNPDAAKKAPTVDASALKEEGVLHVGVNASSYPLAGQANGKMSGLDVDVAAAIGQELGLRVEFVDVGEDGVKALGGDEVDMVMSVESDAAKGKCWVSPGYAPSGVSLFSMDESAALPKNRRFAGCFSGSGRPGSASLPEKPGGFPHIGVRKWKNREEKPTNSADSGILPQFL